MVIQERNQTDVIGVLKQSKWITTALLLTLLLIICAGCHPTEEAKLSEMRRAFRRLNLPLQLEDDELELSNDQVKLDIAKLQGKRQDLTKFRIASFVVEETRRVIHISEEIDRVLSRPDDPATKDQRIKLVNLDKRLDKINEDCHSGARAATTVQEAHAACASLDSAYQEVTSNDH